MLVASLSFPLPFAFLANPASHGTGFTMANDLHRTKGKNKLCDLFLGNHNDSHDYSDQSFVCDGQLVLKAKALQILWVRLTWRNALLEISPRLVLEGARRRGNANSAVKVTSQ